MREIPLTQGKVAIVDDEDFEFFSSHKWHAKKDSRTFYAVRNILLPGKVWAYESMHRMALSRKLGRELSAGENTDHINGDGLDNRRANLRPATKSQNCSNCCRKSKKTTSRYIGVSWYKAGRKWVAQICVNGKKTHLGFHDNEFEAALARESFIDFHPELFAKTNFPPTLWDM